MKTKLKQSITALIIFILLSLTFSSTLALQESTIEYDANGNTIKDNFYSYEYNSFNQLKKVYNNAGQLIEEYKYDENSERILKKEYFNGETQTTYYVNKDFIRVVNSTGSYDFVYYYDDRGNLLGRKDSDGKKYFYHPDHLGSTSIVTDEEGNVVEETSYTPFGALLTGGKSKFLYTGKEKDQTGLYYYGARYYNANFGRFTQPDTIIPDVYDPQSLNRYSYVLNNPYKYTDPTGHYVSPLDFLDYASFAHSTYKMITQPSWSHLKDFAIDTAMVVIPVMGGLGVLNKGVKVANKINDVDNVVDGVKVGEKIGDVNKMNKNLKLLKSGETVYVDSIKGADNLLKQYDSNAIKVKGANPNKYYDFEHISGKTVYKKDYLMNPNTDLVYNHGQNTAHAANKHINIITKDGKKVNIIIGGK